MLCRRLSVNADVVRHYGKADEATTPRPGSEAMIRVAGEHDECSEWAWEAGDAFTMLAFQAPVDADQTGHVIWFMYPVVK